jgi:non-specific serine/threonine protein kinase
LEKRGLICGVRLDGVIYALVWRRAASLKHPMTPREREVACLVAAGNPNKAIAQALRLQPATVAACLRGIFRKLDIRRRAELARDFLLLE